jgi:flagellar hook-basal body complex protein FliE
MALIPPIGAGGVSSLGATSPTKTLGATGTADTATTKRGSDFGDLVSNTLDSMSSQDLTANQMAQDAATGNLKSVSDYMIAENQAQLTTQLTVAVRNKAVDAFNQIMEMNV